MIKLLAKAVASAGMIFSLHVSATDTSASDTAASLAMPAFAATYSLENKYITAGKANFTLRPHNDHYQLVLETRPTGVFKFSDKGKITEAADLTTLQPPYLSNHYSYSNRGDKDRSYTSSYDRDKGEATVERNGTTNSFPINPNSVDRLSTTLTVMQHLRDAPAIEAFSVEMIDHHGIQTVDFVSKGQESLQTELGQIEATRIDRKRSEGSNRHTITWFATLGESDVPVPVQIDQYKRGKLSVRLRIQSFSLIE